jgi:hypothetical protein
MSAGRGAEGIENTASSIVASWTVFTELLPDNALIKSVTIYSFSILSKLTLIVLTFSGFPN